MRYLGVDLGGRRTGLAVGDDATGVVTPLRVIECPAGPALLEAIVAAVADHEPDAVVIGLPLNMDGTEGPQAKLAREVGKRIAHRAARPVHFQDERLSSFAAEELLSGSGRTHGQKKRIRDALAAAAILREYLEAKSDER